jgi:hypothetical protein
MTLLGAFAVFPSIHHSFSLHPSADIMRVSMKARSFLGLFLSWFVLRQLNVSLNTTVVQSADYLDAANHPWDGDDRRLALRVERITVIKVKPPAMILSRIRYGNLTAFELLQQKNNCSATKPVHSCVDDCISTGVDGINGKNRQERSVWCHENCPVPPSPCCRQFTCDLGNPPPLPPVSELHVYPPPPPPDGRLIPRIIHQTWNEPITKERYPHWSFFQQSFIQQEGYEYRFYTDDEARELLQKHFPPEVVSAYDDLNPGAYKADLFRYCILLIFGGVYADVDILMVSRLDELIMNNTGFAVPLDRFQPFFRPSDNRTISLCLWNGFMASSPGHPFLAKVIEHVVNGVRNRFNEVDHVHMAGCPMQIREAEMYRSATLYATGPCILGLAVNQVLGRHEQKAFELGKYDFSTNNVPGKVLFLDAFDLSKVRCSAMPR